MKIMKSKVVAIVLTLAMVFSIFAMPIANAAQGSVTSVTANEAAQFLFEKGVLEGDNGDLMLDKNFKRQDAVVLMSRLLGVEEEAATYPTNGMTFEDVTDPYYAPYIAWAQDMGLVQGYDEKTFGFNDLLTAWQTKALLVRALGYVDTPDEDIEAVADELGITAGATAESDKPALRSYMALLVYNALHATTSEGTILGEDLGILKLVAPVLSDVKAGEVSADGKVTVTGKVEPATAKVTVAGNEIAVAQDGTFSAEVSLVEGENKIEVVAENDGKIDTKEVTVNYVAVPSVTVTASGAKTFKAVFNRAVDTAKATFAVKKSGVTLNVSSVTWNEAKTEATLTMVAKLIEGDYVVTVGGIEVANADTTVKVENEKIAKIELLSDVAALTGTGAKVGYKVYNQYNEDITTSYLAASLTWTASSGTAADDDKGTVSLTGSYTKDQKVVLTGIDSTSGVVVTKTLTIGDASTVDNVTFIGLYNADNKELSTNEDYSSFYVLFDAKDQYGVDVTDKTRFNGATAEVLITSSNPSVVAVGSVVDKQGANADKLAIQLANPSGTKLAGTAKINVITKVTGKVYSFDVTVKEASKVDSFTLSAPTSIVVASEKVEIPFTAVDQYGKAVTDYSALNGVVRLTTTGGTLAFENDYVNKKAVLRFTAPATVGNYVLMAVTPTGKVSQITVEVKEAKVASVIAQVKDVKTYLVKDAESLITVDPLKGNIVVNDQYGREMKLDTTFFTNYYIKATVADDNPDKVKIKEDTNGKVAVIDATADTITLVGVAKGSERIKLEIYKKDNTLIQGSEYEFTVNTVELADIAEFGIEDVAKLYDDESTGYQVDFIVYGVTASGAKVALTGKEYTVTSEIAGVTYTNGKLDANTVTFDPNTTEKKGNVVVVVAGANGPVQLTKEITVSNVPPAVTTITNETTDKVTVDNGVATVAVANATIDNILLTFKAKDQYNVDATNKLYTTDPTSGNITNKYVSVLISNVIDADGGKEVSISNNGSTSASITGLEAGDSFTFTIITSNGKVASINVVVTD